MPNLRKIILIGNLEHKTTFLRQLGERMSSKDFALGIYRNDTTLYEIHYNNNSRLDLGLCESRYNVYAFVILEPDEKLESDFLNHIWKKHPDAKMIMYKGNIDNLDALQLEGSLNNANTFKSDPKQQAIREVRKNARVVEQGGRDKSSLFGNVPKDIRKEIVSLTRDPTLSEDESRKISQEYSEKPKKQK